MSNSRSCIKGHRSSTCNHLGGPLWAVRPAGRPNKACVHGPGDLCLCAHYFPLTWLKAAIPRNKKCSCQGQGSSGKKCMCGHSNGAAASPPDEETQPIFFQDLVARGLQVTTEPVDIDVAQQQQPPSSCCSGSTPAPAPPVQSSCCSQPASTTPAASVAAPAPSSCCSQPPVKSEASTPAPFTNGNGHMKTESFSSTSFTTPAPGSQFQPTPDFKVLAMNAAQAAHVNNGDHICECGPTCNCVLCIDHPYNSATMNHIASEFGHMMTTNGATMSPTIGPNTGAPAAFSQGWPASNGVMANGMMTPTQTFNEAVMPHQSPPQQATDIFLNPADFQMFNFAFPLDNINQYDPQPDFSFGAMPPDMDMSGLCGGMPEGCPCGDDCACIGCLVHGKPTNGASPTTNWS
ncbi:hypothetical protein Daus18300_012463 [Diaporthe australafricana]|uniref:Copper-fist domain-containing protein n=1 Tax=Diaporthe australafricana TaxID=127596 RepID=A0ABR3W2J4_9PEZI